MTAKRKVARGLATTSRTSAPRVLEPTSEPGRLGYPSAANLVSSSGEWRRWLDDALRAVLAPVAIAGAIGVAAAGCGSRVADPPGMPIGATPAASTTGAPGAVLVPMGAQQAGIGTSGKPPAVSTTVIATSVGGESETTPCALTTPAAAQAAAQGTGPRHVVPTTHSVRMGGRPMMVQPIVPVPDPPQLGGEPPAVDP